MKRLQKRQERKIAGPLQRKDLSQYPFFYPGVLLIVLAILLPYWRTFGSMEISKKPEDWTFLFTYLNNTISPILLLFTVYFTIKSIDGVKQQSQLQFEETSRQREIDNLIKAIDEHTRILDQKLERVVFYKTRSGFPDRTSNLNEFRNLYFLNSFSGEEWDFYLDDRHTYLLDIHHYFEGVVLDLLNLARYLYIYRRLTTKESYYETLFRTKYGYTVTQFLNIESSFFRVNYLEASKDNLEELQEKKAIVEEICNFFKAKVIPLSDGLS